jgi:methyltransferase (TIGR00027 family)
LQKQYKYARPGVGDTPWHTREMKITDPFGNHLIFFRNLRVPTDLGLDIAGETALTSVGMTSQWIAASRALETESANPLYRDPLARELAGASGFAMMKVMRAAMGAPDTEAPDPYLTIRTRYLDDAMMAAVGDGSIAQAVILAAGMDMRAFRLDWPAGLTLFEVDRDDVFDHKEAVLERANARPSCDRRIVRADLAREGWVDDLVAAGYNPARPAAILVEGLLMYLEEAQVKQLLAAIGTIAANRSWIGGDLVNTNTLASTFTAAYMKKLADLGCPWKWAVDDPDQFFAKYGWQGRAVVPGEPEASYQRWPFPAMSRTTPGMPRAYFVNARKVAAQ